MGSHRPGITAAMILASGLGLGPFVPTCLRGPAVAAGILAALLAMIAPTRGSRGASRVLRIVALALASLWRGGEVGHLAAPRADSVPGPTAVRVEGVIDVPPISSIEEDGARLRAVTSFEMDGPQGRCRVLCEGSIEDLHGGDRIRVSGSLRPPRGARNPGDGPGPTTPLIAVAHPLYVERLPSVAVVSLPGILGALRERALDSARRLFSERLEGFVLAMTTGDRRLLDHRVRDALLATGTYHLLALSGLHVSVLMFLVLRTPLPRGCRFLVRTGVLVGFTLLTGGSPPILRSALMFALAVGTRAMERRPDALNTLGWTAFFLLALEPSLLTDAGFQLSCISVASILTWARRLLPPRGMPIVPAILLGSLAVSVGTGIGTLPIGLYYFQRLHVLGPLWNLLATPLTLAALFGGLAAFTVDLFAEAPARLIAALSEMACEALLEPLEWGSGFSASSILLPRPDLGCVLAAYAVFLLGLLERRRLAIAAALVLTLLVCLAAWAAPRPAEVWVFDVGEGDALLVTIPAAGSFLLDAGAPGTPEEAGAFLQRAILASGTNSPRAAFSTHPHDDHARGLPGIVRRLSIEQVWTGPADPPPPLLVRGRSLEAPDAESFAVDVLHPAPDDPLLHELNDLSVALRWLHRGEAILTLGDLETPGLTRLLQTPEDLHARVLLLPHHGHACPALRDLLERVRPEIVLVSGAGTSDARAIVEELRAGGITVLATWERGALRLRWIEGRGWTPFSWR